MTSYLVHNADRDSAWDAFVAASPGATAYHQYAWKEVIAGSFGHAPHYLMASDGAGETAGILPLIHMKSRLFGNFLVSVPFVNYGGLLCRSAGAGLALLRAAGELRLSCSARHVELRHLGAGLPELPTRLHKVTMTLSLEEEVGRQWEVFNAKLRNQIRKAQKSDLTSLMGHLDLLDPFYDVFARNMRDLGTPVYAKEFFRQVLTRFPDSTRVVAVSCKGAVVAAGILLWFRENLEMPWASSIREFRPLCPNDLLYWEAIRFGIEQGFRVFDFGRSTPDEGTYHFKKQWGAQPVQLYWQYLQDEGVPLPELNPSNPKYRLAVRLWKHMPLSVARCLGPHLVRNIP